ncbi:hypothetical protein ACFLYH_02545 [Candidatus Dependentiae bacterium]
MQNNKIDNNTIDRDRKITIASGYIAMEKFLLDYASTFSGEGADVLYSLIASLGFFPYQKESSDGGAAWDDYKKFAKLADKGKLSVVSEGVVPKYEAECKIRYGDAENPKRDWLNNK